MMLALGCAACAHAPEARLAVAPSILSEDWQQTGGLSPPDGVSPASSWHAFGSAELDDLIARAKARNTDIAIARARIQQARGQLKVARAASLPGFALSAGAVGSRSDRTGAETLLAGAELSWEADLFGGARAGKRSARANLAAAHHDRDAASLLVESQVADAYFEHSALTERIALVDRSLANARELERIILVRLREGLATRVDSGLQTVEVRRIETRRSELIEARIHVRNALAVLIGEEAPLFSIAGTPLSTLACPQFEPRQPADLLVRRPDVRAAEARIAAAEGDVDRARAAFLPSLTLSARSIAEGVAGGPVQLLTSLGADLLAPIFSGGRLRGRLVTASGVQREAVETYRAALLVALREAEDSLAASQESQRRKDLLAATIEDAKLTAALARRQYVEGAADLQTVLDAERSLVQVEQDYALAARDRLTAAVSRSFDASA